MSNLTDDLKTTSSLVRGGEAREFSADVIDICIDSVKRLEEENAKYREALRGIINIYKVSTSDFDAYTRAVWVAKEALKENS